MDGNSRDGLVVAAMLVALAIAGLIGYSLLTSLIDTSLLPRLLRF